MNALAQMVKNLPAMQETGVQFLCREDPLEKGVATHFSILAWKSHGQKSPTGYSPWGRKESDTTEQLTPFCLPNPILSALYVSTHLSPYHFEVGIIIIVS